MTGALRIGLVAVLVVTACAQPPPPPGASACRLERGAETRAAHDFDAEDLRAAALPKAELGTAYASFTFDWFFAGFESNEERARDKSGRPEEERRDLERFARLVGYQEMYVPPDGSAPVARIFTVVGLFRDAAGASGYLANLPTSISGASAGPFAVSGIGDEVKGYRTVSGSELQTRVNVRRGRLLGTVGINRRDLNDVSQEAIDLARKLDDRLRRSLTGDRRGYVGIPGNEIGAERVQLMALPQAQLGPDYASFQEEFTSSGFQDNEEWTHSASIDPDGDLQEFELCGRVTGFFQAFIPPSDRGYVSTGAHLFSQQGGASDLLAHFVERQKRLAGHSIGQDKIDAVSEVGMARFGDQAAAVLYTFSSGMRRVTVLVRRNRVIGETTVVVKDESAARSQALALARKLDDRIVKVLAGATP